MGIFDYDSPLMETISRITDYVFLTIITLICCIPIVTIGPAFIAKYYVSMKMVRGEEPVVIKSYFRSFKENFKQGVILTLIMLPVVVFFVWDWYLILYTGVKFIPAMKYALGVLTVLTAMAIFSLFPMVARFQITNFEAIKSSFVFALANFLRVLIGIIMIVAPIVIAKYYLKWGWLIMLFASVIMLHLNSMFFVKKFKQVERANAYGDEDDDELYYDELDEDKEDSDEDSEDDAEDADTKEVDEKKSDVKEAKTKVIAVSKSISEEKAIKKSEDKLENKSNDN
ncbi:YesL family protein, partial [Eubacterium sp.]